jgi:hypothetical protein
MEFLSDMLVQRLGLIDQLFAVPLKKGMVKKPLPRIHIRPHSSLGYCPPSPLAMLIKRI